MEQPVWDPNTGTFFVSIPSFNGTDPGGVAEISTAGVVLRTLNLDTLSAGTITSCSPAGLALGGSGKLMIGCSNAGTQTIVLNPAGAGSIDTTIAQISGSDQLYYDPVLSDFFVTGTAGGERVFDVISDLTNSVLQSVLLPPVNAHSIAVNPLNGRVFVPLEGTIGTAQDPLCPLGCIAVFENAAAVAEPGTALLIAAGLIGLVGIGLQPRKDLRRRD
jgi:DNA-binding beta-propeller fold protein YncE